MARAVKAKSAEVIEDLKIDEVQAAIAVQEEKQRPAGNWIKMDEETLIKHQVNGDLVGWDPTTGEGLLKKK